MNEAQAKTWMQQLAESAPPLEPPPFEAVSARARLEAAMESRRRALSRLDWIDAAWQSFALSAVAMLTIWIGAGLQ